ncbi:hypothetical protein BV509_12320 [Rhodovulum sulfidophilum]|uniref:Mu-like prophage FluMu N-terminal domain-containing protein n=2 Tax=Rhodovulum visakhapatnamense TaxID=364297 RepID=A0ABS1RLJ4_9RHOB|nr:hypothetical protein [Rhodovulum visakhapatnamense]MBL3580552.1 hypothetical protein [Rhodovulum visakhapatnamense]OLS45044.1 hypothetical protein BV509_12320 [Rhodovulum sulfidophilum]
MTKVILKFRRAHGRYNRGEVAGFAPALAAKLTRGEDPVATVFDRAAEAQLAAAADPGEIEARAADLAAREAALAEREAALAAAEAKAQAGAPPKQGKAPDKAPDKDPARESAGA